MTTARQEHRLAILSRYGVVVALAALIGFGAWRYDNFLGQFNILSFAAYNSIFALVSLAILLVATMNIAHSFLRAVAERRRELGLLRALGATQRDLAALLLAEAAVLGLCGGIAGLVGARLSALVVDVCARRFVPDFPFKPETFFAFDWSVVAIGVGASVLACLVGALLPARMASRVDPAAALSGS